MNFTAKVNKKYSVTSSGVKDLLISVDTYLNKHPDDYDYLVDMSHSKEAFLQNNAVKKIAQQIDKNLSTDWLYDIVTKKR